MRKAIVTLSYYLTNMDPIFSRHEQEKLHKEDTSKLQNFH